MSPTMLRELRQPWSPYRIGDIDGEGREPDAGGVDSLYDDVTHFIERHRACGTLAGDATEPEWNGYLLTVACSCGTVFSRWVTPDAAARNLLWSPLLAIRN